MDNLIQVRPRNRALGMVLMIASVVAGFFFVAGMHPGFPPVTSIPDRVYRIFAVPLGLVTLALFGNVFRTGYIILTIKVVPPMPDFKEKNDLTKPKALLLCLVSLGLIALFGYGIYLKSFWALALPAAFVVLVFLGAVFWIGWAILFTRTTIQDKSGE